MGGFAISVMQMHFFGGAFLCPKHGVKLQKHMEVKKNAEEIFRGLRT